MKNFETIQEFNDMLGVETLHPLVSVVNLSQARPMKHMRHTNSFYSVMLKDEKFCDIIYGRSRYDYDKGSVVSTAPGQVIGIENTTDELFQPVGWGLFFSPELIHGTSLVRHLKEYTFFEYQANEALHLSERERETFLHCLGEIQSELEHGIDRLTRRLVVSNIEILLDHLLRFYERQFITREITNSDLLTRFEKLLNSYFEGTNAAAHGLPTVRYCAKELCLSPNYFGDLIRKETGKTAQEHIKLKTIDAAKNLLADPQKSITDVAYDLGFQYPQHLSRFFKKETGLTPAKYRQQIMPN
ncbi:MAG: AraC family transcriptional regulator [Muribaculaceae bacterium]|nr:AraC family transcriptional regulator [Muribaculaceae bacterium]